MSQRDGYEWGPLNDCDKKVCEGQSRDCEHIARYEKILYACDKSCYCGGFYCDKCIEEMEDTSL